MGIRFPDYILKVGDDIGDPDVLNSIIRDVDLRVAKLEDIEKDWTKALADLTVIGLARMIMSLDMAVQLRVLVPAVENVVSGNALKPKDILTSRKGLTVEVNDTDAEGRLILADALAYACEGDPEVLISMATVTVCEMFGLMVYAAGSDALARRFQSPTFAHWFFRIAALAMVISAMFAVYLTWIATGH